MISSSHSRAWSSWFELGIYHGTHQLCKIKYQLLCRAHGRQAAAHTSKQVVLPSARVCLGSCGSCGQLVRPRAVALTAGCSSGQSGYGERWLRQPAGVCKASNLSGGQHARGGAAPNVLGVFSDCNPPLHMGLDCLISLSNYLNI